MAILNNYFIPPLAEVGWALGDERQHGLDPAWDAREAEQPCRLLEEEMILSFYDRYPKGIPGRALR